MSHSPIADISGANRSAMPHSIEPMKAVLADAPFEREGWIFEEKYDGIRTLCYIEKGKASLFSRNQKEMTARYPELGNIAEWVDASGAVLDGEIIVVDQQGHASFQELQARFGLRKTETIAQLARSQKIIFYVFDLLYLDGYNLMGATLLDRKALLHEVVRPKAVFQVAPHTLRDGLKRFKTAEKGHLEGIMAKNGHSAYEEGRSDQWLKIKTSMRQEVVICGYTRPRGSREYFGALHLGLYDDGRLVSVGKVGTGFDRKRLKDIYEAMQPFVIDSPPFDAPFPDTTGKKSRWGAINGPVQWLRPKLVCEVKFTERTADGNFRHPVFEGLRFDKKATECTFEAPARVSALTALAKASSKSAPRVAKKVAPNAGRTVATKAALKAAKAAPKAASTSRKRAGKSTTIT